MKVSYNQLQDLTGMSYRTIKKRIEGLEPIGAGQNNANLFDSRDALRLIYNHDKTAGGKLDAIEEKALLDKSKRIAQEMKNAETEGRLIDATDNAKFWTDCILAWKSKLQSIPTKLANLINPDDRQRCFDLARKEIDELLTDMANVKPD